ncbi:MAG: RNA polymerase sigma factor [Deltaproteobacteria bacterium]|nr:MAG: RNA polymerase sigma factor [Deltaproteobacteria bacterium]
MNPLATLAGSAAVGDGAPPDARVVRHAVAATDKVPDLASELEALHAASFAWAMCCCRFVRTEAEDVLHASYMKVLEGRARFAGRSTFRTWLFGIIRRTALDARRRELARRILTGRIIVDAFAPAADDAIDAARDRAQVRRALNALSARQRQVLELVVHQGITLDEAAAVLTISPGTARKHYERGKTALRAALARMRSR